MLIALFLTLLKKTSAPKYTKSTSNVATQRVEGGGGGIAAAAATAVTAASICLKVGKSIKTKDTTIHRYFTSFAAVAIKSKSTAPTSTAAAAAAAYTNSKRNPLGIADSNLSQHLEIEK